MSDIKAEPVAWRWKERVNDDFVIEWALTKYEPATTPRTVAIEPLYTADAIRAAVLAERERLLSALTRHDWHSSGIWRHYYPSATGDWVDLRELRKALEPQDAAIRKEPT